MTITPIMAASPPAGDLSRPALPRAYARVLSSHTRRSGAHAQFPAGLNQPRSRQSMRQVLAHLVSSWEAISRRRIPILSPFWSPWTGSRVPGPGM